MSAAVAAAAPVPAHLQDLPVAPPKRFGEVRYDATRSEYVVVGEPQVVELCRRLFPSMRRHSHELRFSATQRAVEDLHWLMLRYPLAIECPLQYERDRRRAIVLAQRRNGLLEVRPATPPPSFLATLRPYQADDVARMVAMERVLNANDMGLGKTVEGLAALVTAGATPALLVVQPHVQLQWQVACSEFLRLQVGGVLPHVDPPRDLMCHRIRGLKPYRLPHAPLYLIHYGLLDRWVDTLKELELQAVVFDEVQELRRTESLKYAAALALSSMARYCWGLSGTPIYNYGAEIWAVLNAISFHCLGSQAIFVQDWCGYGDRVMKPDVLGAHLVAEGLMIRRRKSDADVASQLPPKQRAVVAIDQDEDVYRKLIGQAVRLARGWDGMGFHEKGEALREISQESRQAAGVAKAGHVAAFVQSLVEAGERPVVFAHHHQVHWVLTEGLAAAGVARMTGLETTAQKEQAKQRFLSGQDKVCLLALRASTGIDGLQKVGTCVVFAELDWSPAIHRQCEDRLHRDGLEGVEHLMAYYLVADNSYDAVVRSVLGLKVAQSTGLLGDQPESAEDRGLAEQVAEDHLKQLVEALRSTKGAL